MPTTDCRADRDWLRACGRAVRDQGYCVVESVLSAGGIERARQAMYRAQRAIVAEVGAARLERAGEVGVLRLMMKFEPALLGFLELPELLAVVDAHLSPTAILHLQNGFILPPSTRQDVFQFRFHQDFPRVLNGYPMSINAFFALDYFDASNGGTWVVPGTHQRGSRPDDAHLERAKVCVECRAGAINHQFTRSYVKQQIDYVRALGDDAVTRLPPRSQQLLGYYTRVVTSLDEYYRSGDERLYRAGQG
jgi:ectoine hydroxylase-related dioxygenase (phytanoyl-CoA dioxygenase family)